MWLPLRLRETFEIRRHLANIRKIDRAYELKLSEGGKEKDREKIADQRQWESELYYDQIKEIKTRRILRKAMRLEVPFESPTNESPRWRQSHQLLTWHLTTFGYSEIRKAIRQEKRERRDVAITWSGVVVGIIGSLTGLLSVYLSLRK
ncbi:hypothetical protein MesoLj131c_16430 [Mesorhizobium sp. 131-3-5]|uniref:hypothetical protein n=1 Tax=Mesorhizobium sp. 131-3-5 TaxID=2744520 RepID=UPI001929557D|nr:hypothetical protein [Mesorhizobium sp. 131-3-5]BCH07385.1 hypothetical protein MesoLj131c_16430 [Mesorhizobium sp. 131-3-5]